ncbi:class I alpha-mannosidase [Blastomyces gilchristii SLH14081]|uniref:alpha-1,2-Mannosidase n=1 Tax=Blastomyces gilchristii (strain SLH14081) TaxID=559298 RepID=A0A179U933_BLAGS|nr:class I alpha-mannosidase [Blastomyces gilchristii SLH14081]OAT03667.1 class I alpha-mannosidase [Blastomyces gilchristii SLH14081]
MLRLRRYRVFVVFAIISVVVFVHFFRIRDWSGPPTLSNEPVEKQKPLPPPTAPPSPNGSPALQQTPGVGNSNDHGFAPESKTAIPSSDPLPSPSPVAKPPAAQPSVPSSPQKESTKPHPLTKPHFSPSEDDEFGSPGKGRVEANNPDSSDVRWEKQPEHFPVAPEDLIKLPQGMLETLPKIQFEFPEESPADKADREAKLAAIKQSFNHSWTSYKAEAWGHDELRPVLGGYRNPFSGWGATLVDGLDTLWIMGMVDEFEEAVEAINKIDFATSPRKDIPLFETVIRYLGGLIGAYDVSGGKYQCLIDKAVELAEILIGAFDTPNRMPVTYYHWAPAYASQPQRASSRTVTAEIGTLSLEFTRLTQITKEEKYYNAVAWITNELEKYQEKTKLPGLWPTHIDASGCKKIMRLVKQPAELPIGLTPPTVPEVKLPERHIQKREEMDPILVDAEPADYNLKPGSQPLPTLRAEPSSDDDQSAKGNLESSSEYDCKDQDLTSPPKFQTDRFTLGGLVDSAYEYLPKQYALLGGLNEQYRTMYEKSMNAVRKYLLFRPMLPDKRDILFIASAIAREPVTEKDDLMLTYEGSHLACFTGGMFALGAKLFGIESDLDIAAKLTEGCVWAYESTTTGIMPESFEMLPCGSLEPCEWNKTRYYDALDPYFEERKSYHDQIVADHAQQLAKSMRSNEPATSFKSDPPKRQSIPGAPGEKPDAQELVKRQDLGPPKTAETAAIATPAVIPPFWNEIDVPAFLSHAEFAEATIKEDRLPPGVSTISARKYILRPEAIESVFIMYRITGDNSWRQKGWNMFQAVEAATRTDLGNSAIKDVTSRVPMFLNEMESFWLAETLKYFYLLFSDPELVSLDEYVLNTEAHPHKRPLP